VEEGAWCKFCVSSKRTERSGCWLPGASGSSSSSSIIDWRFVLEAQRGFPLKRLFEFKQLLRGTASTIILDSRLDKSFS